MRSPILPPARRRFLLAAIGLAALAACTPQTAGDPDPRRPAMLPIIVELRIQPPPTQAEDLALVGARIRAVEERVLAALGARAPKEVRRFGRLPYLGFDADGGLIEALLRSPDVAAVRLDRERQLQ